jgi:hypothetical protein
MGFHTAINVSVLVTSGCTAGSLLAAWGVGVDITIMREQTNRTLSTLSVSQPAAIVTCKIGIHCTHQVIEAVVM